MTEKKTKAQHPKFFAKPSDFRKWLEKNHMKAKELLVGFYKVGTGKPSITWPEAVDEALCFGWIDGVRRSIDGESYLNRFTPRRPKSNWSDINIKKVKELIRQGKMTEQGLKLFESRDKSKPMDDSPENRPQELSPAYEKIFRTNKKAWNFFSKQAPSYRKFIIYWIMSAKQEKTQLARLEKAITGSSNGKKL